MSDFNRFPSNVYEAVAWKYTQKQVSEIATPVQILNVYKKAMKELEEDYKAEHHDTNDSGYDVQFFRHW